MDRLEEAMIVLGPQDRYFPAAEVAQLTGTTFAASARFDRMGRVLEGTPLVPSRLDIVSEPAVRGSLQIDGEGKLTMLSADHQTTGGYPKIATVAGAHVDRIAQLESESPLRFRAVSVEQATAEWRRHAAMAEAYLKGVGAPLPPLGTRLLEANLIDGVVDARR